MSNVFNRNTKKFLPVIDRGEGIYLFDIEGKRYVDGSSGALVSNVGHGMEDIAQVLANQARTCEFVHGTQFGSVALEKLASKIVSMSPPKLNKIYFVSGGSEATETAIKICRQYHAIRGNLQKYKIITRWQSYHGATLGALSISGRTPLRKLYTPLFMESHHIPPVYCYRCPFKKSYPGCDLLCAYELETTIKQLGPEYISAFIAEPVVGPSLGVTVPPNEYFAIIREICTKYGVLFIADEIMTGFGRTGRNFAVDHWDVVPDIIIGSKGLGAGYWPVYAVIVSEEIYDTFKKGPGRFIHGFTYQNSIMGGAVGAKVLEIIEKKNLINNSKIIGKYLLERLYRLKDYRIIGDIRGIGLMTGIEFVKDKASKEPFSLNSEVTQTIVRNAFKRGLIVYPSSGIIDGIAGDAVLIAPPLISTTDQIDEILNIFEDTVKEAEKRIFKK